jgi:Co/Zn/Cd efflux system component
VLIESFIRFYSDAVPNSFTMSWVGILALIINALVAFLLFRYKDGDSNMQSVWLCSRNDAIGNLAVVFASIGVYFYSSKWPDLVVALFMASLSVSASFKVLVLVRKEFESTKVECAG